MKSAFKQFAKRLCLPWKRAAGSLPALAVLAVLAVHTASAAVPAAAEPADAATGATLPASSASASKADIGGGKRLTIALLDTLVNPFDSFYLQATIRRLEKALPGYRWRTITISAAEAKEDLARAKPDFLFAPAGFVGMMSPEINASRIATRKTMLADRAEASVGAAFVVRAGENLEAIPSLKGKRAASGMPLSIDGWLAAAGEILEAGYDPEQFFSSVDYFTNAYPDVISSLLAGKTDVAILPACLLETMRNRDLIDSSGLRIAGEKKGGLACAHSTALYPDVSLLSLPGAPEEAVRDVTIAILSDRNTRDYEWLTNVSFAGGMPLFEALKLGPYQYLRDLSPGAILARHRTEFLFAVALLIFLLLNELRLHRLVRQRTKALADSMEERRREASRAEGIRRRLALFERRSIVQQMSGMIAHEINAPIGSIRTYAAMLRMCGQASQSSAREGDDYQGKALDGIEAEAVRISEIVARVRRYAKTSAAAHHAVDLDEILKRSIRALKAEEPEVPVRVSAASAGSALVLGDALELELLFLNLLRNAAAAARPGEASGSSGSGARGVPLIDVHVEHFEYDVHGEQKGPHDPAALRGSGPIVNVVQVEISNPGPVLGADVVAELNSRASGFVRALQGEEGAKKAASGVDDGAVTDPLAAKGGSESHGLGLGLTICRGIADSHGASLRFEARQEGGARVVVSFDAYEPDVRDAHLEDGSLAAK